MSTSIKFIKSGQRGAPPINGTAGSLISALDAHFLSGYGTVTPLSVTVSGGVATAEFSPGESFDMAATVLVSGGTPSGINGEAKILTQTNSQATWATSAPDGVVTGSLTVKYAPQSSWVKQFAGTNKAAYKSEHIQANGHFLRVDDAYTNLAYVRGYESMSDVDSGVGPFPTTAQFSSSAWPKANAAGASAATYKIFSDERFLLVCIAAFSSATPLYMAAPARGFGDPIALSPGGDVWSTVLSNHGVGLADIPSGSFSTGLAPSGTTGSLCSPRALSGLGSSVVLRQLPLVGGTSLYSGLDSTLGSAPSEVDGQIKLTQVYVKDGASTPPRAIVPGLYYVPQTGTVSLFSDGEIMEGSGELAGRHLMCVLNGSYSSQAQGVYFVDITGPWR